MLPDLETLTVMLGGDEEKKELIEELQDYFGDYDARTVLAVALYLKYPQKYWYLRDEILARMVPY